MFVKTDEVEGPLNESNNGTEMTLAATPCPIQRSKIRRIISHSYERMGCPPEWTRDGSFNQWKGKGGVIARLKSDLDISWKAEYVYGVLSKTRAHFTLGTLNTYDAGAKETKRPRKRKLGDKEIQLGLKTVRDSLGLETALRRANDYRRAHLGKEGVSYEFLRSSLLQWGAICHLRQTRKTGNRDPFSCWAVFRHQFALQLQHQFAPDFELRESVEGWGKLCRHGVLFTDEHHEKCMIGKANTSKHEWVCALHKDDHSEFVPMYLEDGVTPNPDAVFLPNSPRPKAKFEAEARGLFAVAMVKDPITGEMVGRKAKPFNYSCCTVVGGARYTELCRTPSYAVPALWGVFSSLTGGWVWVFL